MSRALAAGLAILVVLSARPTLAAGLSAADVDRLIGHAAQLQEAARWADALAALEQGIARCGPDDEGRPCRVALSLRAGYIAERWSRREEGAEPPARRAASFYEAVLKDAPRHGPALNNLALVYRSLGETARGIALLRGALTADHALASTVGVTLGDLLRQARKTAEALDAYRRALAEDPDDLAAAQRIVGLYRAELPDRIDQLPKLLAEWSRRSTLDEAVEQGHRAVIEATYAGAERLALESLVRWVELSARRRWLSARSLDALPAAWRHAAVTDLAAYVAAPERAPSRSWWLGTAPARNALAAVALALGHERLGKGDAAGAAARWTAGVALSPLYDEYQYRSELKGVWMVRADLQAELASLYFKHPALDPQHREFSRLVADLFGGKAQAYGLGDREAIQRYHTVLGLLFAQRKEWKSRAPYMNAVFQLSNAIKTADARAPERGPQPLPELKALLARGYAETGRTRDARATYARAAEAYLDTDDLGRAGEMLAHGRRLPGPPAPGEPALGVIVTSRAAIPATPKTALAADAALKSSREHAWIFGGTLAGLGADFVARQRFKALADFSARAAEVGDGAAATRYAAAALDRGVKDVHAFVDFGDLVRLRNVRRTVTAPLRLDAPDKIAGKAWLLSVPGETAPRRVEVSAEEVLAGRVLETLESHPAVLSRDVSVTISGSKVQLEGGDDSHLRDAARKLGRLPGVSGIEVRTR